MKRGEASQAGGEASRHEEPASGRSIEFSQSGAASV